MLSRTSLAVTQSYFSSRDAEQQITFFRLYTKSLSKEIIQWLYKNLATLSVPLDK